MQGAADNRTLLLATALWAGGHPDPDQGSPPIRQPGAQARGQGAPFGLCWVAACCSLQPVDTLDIWILLWAPTAGTKPPQTLPTVCLRMPGRGGHGLVPHLAWAFSTTCVYTCVEVGVCIVLYEEYIHTSMVCVHMECMCLCTECVWCIQGVWCVWLCVCQSSVCHFTEHRQLLLCSAVWLSYHSPMR